MASWPAPQLGMSPRMAGEPLWLGGLHRPTAVAVLFSWLSCSGADGHFAAAVVTIVYSVLFGATFDKCPRRAARTGPRGGFACIGCPLTLHERCRILPDADDLVEQVIAARE